VGLHPDLDSAYNRTVQELGPEDGLISDHGNDPLDDGRPSDAGGEKDRSDREGGEPSAAEHLPLAVLEPLARARLTVLFTLLLSSVAGQEACAFDGTTLFGIEGDERSCDAMSHGFGLGALSSAGASRPDVELVLRLDELESLAKDHAGRLTLEIVVDRPSIDHDRAAAGLEPNAGYGGFALSRGVGASICRYHFYA
jgi:hypothetical protein